MIMIRREVANEWKLQKTKINFVLNFVQEHCSQEHRDENGRGEDEDGEDGCDA